MSILFDLHTHSTLSFDGGSSAEDMVFRACELGMEYYALTDHVEIERFTDPEYNCDRTVAEAAVVIPALRDKYSDRIKLIYGVELGQPMHNKALTDKILAENSYDYIIGSSHTLRGMEDFYFLDYTKEENEPYKLLDIYFDEMLELVRWNGFDILAHITYPLRYIVGEYGISIDIGRYADIIDEIFITLIRNGKGIEINTSGLRQKIGVTLPELSYIRRFRELGGEILSIGSDAHNTDDLGKGIDEGIKLAKEAGFDKITYFIERKPNFIKI